MAKRKNRVFDGAALKAAREKAGLSVYALRDKVLLGGGRGGTKMPSHVQMRRWETGEAEPRAGDLAAVCRALDIPIESVLRAA